MSRSFSFYPTYVNTRWEQFTFTAPSCFLSCKLHFFYLITNKTLSTHGHRQCTRRIIIACLVISRSRAKEAEKEILRDRKRPTLKPHERKTRGTLGNLAANVLSRARAKKPGCSKWWSFPRYAKESRLLFTSRAGDNHRRGEEKNAYSRTHVCTHPEISLMNSLFLSLSLSLSLFRFLADVAAGND
jgi:hypothetical protein